jgi:hypothetical protein
VKTGKSLTIPVRCRPAPDAIGFDTNATVVELNAPVALPMCCSGQIQSPDPIATRLCTILEKKILTVNEGAARVTSSC